MHEPHGRRFPQAGRKIGGLERLPDEIRRIIFDLVDPWRLGAPPWRFRRHVVPILDVLGGRNPWFRPAPDLRLIFGPPRNAAGVWLVARRPPHMDDQAPGRSTMLRVLTRRGVLNSPVWEG